MSKTVKNLKIAVASGAAVAALSLAMVHAQDKTTTAPVATLQPVAANSLTHQTVLATPAATTTSPSTAATASASASPAAKPAASNFYKPNFHPGNILLRKPNGPAVVQWAAARAQFSKMRPLRKINGFAAALPKAELDRTLLPVILPHDGSVINTAKSRMMSFGDAYALNLPQAKGTQITMYGNRSFVSADQGAVSKRPFVKLVGVPEDVRIEQTEDGWTATFTRYGVVYSLDVSCDDIASADCQTDSYIRNAIGQFDDVTMGAQANAEADRNMNGPQVTPKTPAPGTNWLDQVSKSIKSITGIASSGGK